MLNEKSMNADLVGTAVEKFAQVLPLDMAEIFTWYFEQKGVENPERFLNQAKLEENKQNEELQRALGQQQLAQQIQQQQQAQQMEQMQQLMQLKGMQDAQAKQSETKETIEKFIPSLSTMVKGYKKSRKGNKNAKI